MKPVRITLLSRIGLFCCGLALIAVLFKPMWRIDLQAPQYPEGLRMQIYANKLAGDVAIINGLNHYIGMKTLHDDDFPEFKILPGIIMAFCLLFAVAAIIGKRKWVNILWLIFISFGVVAMIDFWRWEYAYGHNLNPDAAIVVPGMAYQPPLIGFKQLLNFGAWSVPDTGGWIFVGAGVLLTLIVILEWRRQKKFLVSNKSAAPAVALLLILFSSCSTEPEPIRVGKDNCAFCKMPISDNRFGAEVVSKKSKLYKFDDEHCLYAFLKGKQLAEADIAAVYFVDFCVPHKLVKAEQALFLQSPLFKTPMNGNIAAFSHADSLRLVAQTFNAKTVSWKDIRP
ncbi:MAG: hypothetical protein JWQ27_3190 [Ferruginibacter sp.]|nr:hypothetical protein [Ferruginibacter sp.]